MGDWKEYSEQYGNKKHVTQREDGKSRKHGRCREHGRRNKYGECREH